MEARGTPMPPSQAVPLPPSGVPCLCVQPDQHLALALHDVPLLSEAIDALPLPESGMASTLVSVDLRNDVILEEHERLTPPHLASSHRGASFDGSNSQLAAVPSGMGAVSAPHTGGDTPTECSVELAGHTAQGMPLAPAARNTVIGGPATPMGSALPTSGVSAGSARHQSHTAAPEGPQPEQHPDRTPLHHSARHRNPYAFMLDRGLQDPAHWSGDVVASRGSVRGLLNLGATLLSSRGSMPHWQKDALEWAAVEVPVYRAYITADLAKWLAVRPTHGTGKLTAGLLAVLTGGSKPSSVRSSPGMHLESAQSIASRSRSHNGVRRVGLPSSVERRSLSMGAAAGRPTWRLNSPPSWSAATAAGSPVLLSSGSLRSNGGAQTGGPGNAAYARVHRRPTSEENRSGHLFPSHSQATGTWMPMSGPGSIAPASFATQNKVLRMSDLGEYGGGDEHEHIASGQWVPPPPVVARGLHGVGMEVPWSELSLLPPEGACPAWFSHAEVAHDLSTSISCHCLHSSEHQLVAVRGRGHSCSACVQQVVCAGMVPVSVVASGAVSQPWLHNGDHALGGCAASLTSQGRSLCGMATVFESLGSGSDQETLESLRGHSDHTTNSNGSNGASNTADREACATEGDRSCLSKGAGAHTVAACKLPPSADSAADRKVMEDANAHKQPHVPGTIGRVSDSVPAGGVVGTDHDDGMITHSAQLAECTQSSTDGSRHVPGLNGESMADEGWNTVICDAEVVGHPSHASSDSTLQLAAAQGEATAGSDTGDRDKVLLDAQAGRRNSGSSCVDASVDGGYSSGDQEEEAAGEVPAKEDSDNGQPFLTAEGDALAALVADFFPGEAA